MYKKKLHSIVILIPSYNELGSLKKFLLKLKKNFDVFVIDDHSSDKTHKWLKENKILFFRNHKNLGYEKSLLKGIKIILQKKKYKFILTMDADGQHTIDSLKKFSNKYSFLQDIVVGKRNKTNRIIENIISFIFYRKKRIFDPLCGLKLYKSELLKKINLKHIKDYFLVDLLYHCLARTKKVKNVNIKILPRDGKPKIGNYLKANIKLFKILIYCFAKI